MNEWALIKDWLPTINTPLLLYLVWLVARLYTNHLPHLESELEAINKRLAHLEGIAEGVKLERMKE